MPITFLYTHVQADKDWVVIGERLVAPRVVVSGGGGIALDKALFSTKKYLYFSYFSTKTCCGYSLEAPRRGASNDYPQHMFSSRNKKAINLIPILIWTYGGEGGGSHYISMGRDVLTRGLIFSVSGTVWSGRVVRRCRVSCVTGASN